MVQIVIVEKNGSLKEVNIKQYDSEFLCKKAGFKNSNGFKAHTCWKQENMEVYLYGKTEGRAGQENKYDMPPPSDNTLFFGSCLLLMKKKNKEVDLTVKSWKEIYESLFGGFEDVGDEDSEEDAEEDDEDADNERIRRMDEPVGAINNCFSNGSWICKMVPLLLLILMLLVLQVQIVLLLPPQLMVQVQY